MNNRSLIVALIFVIPFFTGCSPNKTNTSNIPTDSATVAQGARIFAENCSACHDFRRDGIGPHLGGITEGVSADWIAAFIKNPAGVLESGDARGQRLFARYKTIMPSFGHLSDAELTGIVAYLHTQKTPDTAASARSGPEPLSDPLPEPIPLSGLKVGVEFITQIPASAKAGSGTHARITKLGFIPETERLFIVDIRGKLYELHNGVPKVYLDMAERKPDFIDKPGLATGFGSFAFHPEFRKNGLLYTGHAEKAGSAKADFSYADSIPVAMQWVVTEWKATDPSAFPFNGTSRELLRINMVGSMHGVQEFAFNPFAKPGDEAYGLLYIGIGDGSSVHAGFPFLAGTTKSALGSIFRIDPQGDNSANGRYGIPPSNPFAKDEDSQRVKEIYAYGFRNPHRLSWTEGGQMLVSNIGQKNIESINLIQSGHHYGWPYREGTFLFNASGDLNMIYPLPADEMTYDFTYPAAQYDHDEGAAIIGGFEYTGSAVPELRGKYVFGDMNNGRLFYLELNEVRPESIAAIREFKITVDGRPTSTAELCGKKRVDLRLGKDHNGEIYFFSKQDGKVYRFTAAKHRAISQR